MIITLVLDDALLERLDEVVRRTKAVTSAANEAPPVPLDTPEEMLTEKAKKLRTEYLKRRERNRNYRSRSRFIAYVLTQIRDEEIFNFSPLPTTLTEVDEKGAVTEKEEPHKKWFAPMRKFDKEGNIVT